mgnify:CR=1 FL=1
MSRYQMTSRLALTHSDYELRGRVVGWMRSSFGESLLIVRSAAALMHGCAALRIKEATVQHLGIDQPVVLSLIHI